MSVLQSVSSPEDLKKLTACELKRYCYEAREFLINTVSETGGHLASNLGVVELTCALHYVFNCHEDKFVWDVGHQAYVHKMITGRLDYFSSLRSIGGLAGFPKTTESECDSFNTGHSSTAISAALGITRARDLSGESFNVISIIGDGALTGGMAFEALADAGQSNNRMIVIVNDNEMSISKNVGGISNHLSNLRTGNLYNRFRRKVKKSLENAPILENMAHKLHNSFKYSMVPNTIFEALGFRYIGPIDGHNLSQLIKIFERVKSLDGNIVIHVKTVKGKGYKPAEDEPSAYHGVSKSSGGLTFSSALGKALLEAAEEDKRIVAVSASMQAGTGIEEFAKKYPDRFFDTGIAEQHAATLAAGMASRGFIPVFPVYSSFLQRAYDQVLHDICLQNLHVVLCVDRAGLVGEDGETHHGAYDISYLKHMPNMTILAPSCIAELYRMFEYALYSLDGPVAIRYPKGNQKLDILYHTPLEYGKGELLISGKDVLIVASGNTVPIAFEVSDILTRRNIASSIIDLRFASPVDDELILSNLEDKKLVVVIEDNVDKGGISEDVVKALYESGIRIPFLQLGLGTAPISHGSVADLRTAYGISPEKMAEKIMYKLLKFKG